MTITKKMKEIIDDFIIHAFHQLSTIYITVPIQSFAGIILTLEARLRNRPDTLDSPSVPILLTNLLLTLYHGIHEHAIKEDISKTIKDPLTNLVYLILKSDDPINDFTFCVQIAATHLEGLDLYEFLRRCAIIEDFALRNDSVKGKFIDWDDVLSFNNLLLRFHVAVEDDNGFELSLFETIKLPEEFFNLCMPPYKLELFDYSVMKVLDLITGKECILPTKNYQNVKDSIVDYVSCFDWEKGFVHSLLLFCY